MSTSAPVGQQKSSSTNPIPLTTPQAVEEFREWMRKQYALAFNPPESIDACRDSHALAFNAGIIRVYQDLKVISDKDHNRK